jgi:hypothetical protein
VEGGGFKLIDILVENLTRRTEQNYERTDVSRWLDFVFVDV